MRVYLTINLYLKKILAILLAISVLAFGMQTPCMAMFEEEDTCASTSCCDDEAPASEDDDTNSSTEDGSCCVYNVLSTHDHPAFATRYIPHVISNATCNQAFHAEEVLFDFWQPPRVA